MDKSLVKKIILGTIIISLVILGIFFIVFKNPKKVILGFIFGSIISILGLKLLHTSIIKAVDMETEKASSYVTIHYNIRYFIYFIVLSIGALADYLSFPATVLGLFMVKLTIVLKIKKSDINERPSNFLNLVELLVEAIEKLVTTTMGDQNKTFAPYILTLAMFLAVANLFVLIDNKRIGLLARIMSQDEREARLDEGYMTLVDNKATIITEKAEWINK